MLTQDEKAFIVSILDQISIKATLPEAKKSIEMIQSIIEKLKDGVMK